MSSPWAPAAGCSVGRVQAGDLGEPALERPEQLEGALGELVGLVRVQAGEALQRRDALVDLGVVLHRAGAQRVGARLDAVVERRELGVVADEVDLGDLGQARRRGAPQRRRQQLRRADARGRRPPARVPARRPARDFSKIVWTVGAAFGAGEHAPDRRRGAAIG